ncbi:glycosyltransferase family A protein [Citromicrobium bathyomarinum]|uniref:glycosyltransferase family 2 protein n=1 Tax=Citromicrobium bathyomarinum TaxID=72174 RepID=UPI00315AEA5D
METPEISHGSSQEQNASFSDGARTGKRFGITILTPTWDRACLLPRLHESIASQASAGPEIDWLVIDDGSRDETARLVAGWAERSGFPIRYEKIEHGGKHRALNRGFALATGDWVAIIDSDDWLMEGGLRRLHETLQAARQADAKIAFMPIKVIDRERQYRFRQPNRRVDVAERYDAEPDFDCTCAFHKSLQPIALREFGGEKFLAEASLMHNLPAGVGAFLSDAICVAVEYQPDGLSATILRQRMDSPVGATFTYQSIFRNSARLPTRLRSLLNYARFWWHARLTGRTPCTPLGPMQALMIPAALPLAIIDRIRTRPED